MKTNQNVHASKDLRTLLKADLEITVLFLLLCSETTLK